MKLPSLFVFGAALGSLLAAINPASAQGTAFTYQGLLNDSGNPANGLYDIQFGAYDAVNDGNLVGSLVTNTAVAVSNGLFTTTIDFGAGVFAGQPLWLDLAVSTNGADTFDAVTPRQPLTPTPYAIFSSSAGSAAVATTAQTVSAGVISADSLGTVGAPAPGQVLGFSGAQLVWQDPVVGGSSGGWSLTGNLGTSPGANFLGTLDTQPLELKVAGARALRLEPDGLSSGAPNVIGGSSANSAAGGVIGAAISGGGAANLSGLPYPNSVSANFGSIGGGVKNVAAGQYARVGGGFQNLASGYISTVGGGAYNDAITNEASVLGGAYNLASGIGATIGGGGYDGSTAQGNLASGPVAFVGGGLGNSASGYGTSIAGGQQNNAGGDTAAVGGGYLNSASGSDTFHYFQGQFLTFFLGGSTVGGGYDNTASASGATVPGGALNTAGGDLSFAAGFRANAANPGCFVWSDTSSSSTFTSTGANQFLIRAAGGVGIGTASPQSKLHVFDSVSVSHRVETGGGVNAWARIEFANGNGQWNVGTSRGYNGDQLYFNRQGISASALALQPSGDATFSGNVSVCTLTIRGGCDLAEPFATTEAEIEKGSVVVIDPAHPGQLKLSNSAYDTRVAGVVSGANGINPGIAMHQEGALEGGQNVALTGRVYALADASSGAIEPGDLLTTSSTPGHAMKAADHARAQGAILGKAMTGLARGRGMVLVLVTLQ